MCLCIAPKADNTTNIPYIKPPNINHPSPKAQFSNAGVIIPASFLGVGLELGLELGLVPVALPDVVAGLSVFFKIQISPVLSAVM
jgi:hypothetical protein